MAFLIFVACLMLSMFYLGIRFEKSNRVKAFIVNILEGVSQSFNTFHDGNANQTFSARLREIRDGEGHTWILPHWYWRAWISFFERFVAGHLDWAAGPDEGVE